MDIFTNIEQSGIGTWVRESPSVLGYPTFLFLHTVGLGLLVGTSVTVDLRILGVGKTTALQPMNKLYPLIWLGFWISAVSGAALWTADAATWSKDVVFYIKMVLIALGMLHMRLIRSRVLNAPDFSEDSAGGRGLAVASLIFWMSAMTAGRLTAYIGK